MQVVCVRANQGECVATTQPRTTLTRVAADQQQTQMRCLSMLGVATGRWASAPGHHHQTDLAQGQSRPTLRLMEARLALHPTPEMAEGRPCAIAALQLAQSLSKYPVGVVSASPPESG